MDGDQDGSPTDEADSSDDMDFKMFVPSDLASQGAPNNASAKGGNLGIIKNLIDFGDEDEPTVTPRVSAVLPPAGAAAAAPEKEQVSNDDLLLADNMSAL